MASMYYLIALTLLLGVASAQDVERFQQPFESVTRPLIKGIVGNPYICEACENFVGILKNITEDNETLEAFVTLLLPVCDWVPYVMHQECKDLIKDIPACVKDYADMYLDPKRDCAYVCQGTMSVGPRPDAQTLMNVLGQMQKTAKKYN